MKQLFATTARGFEELLKVELTELGATECKIAQGGVHFQADDETLYRSLLWSRLASRILLPIVNDKIYSDLDLYSIVTVAAREFWETQPLKVGIRKNPLFPILSEF